MFVIVAIWNRAGHYVFIRWFLSFSVFFFFFPSPNLSSRRLYVYHTSTHGVPLVRIYNAGLKCAARGMLNIQDAKNRHLRTIAQICRAVFSQLRHVSTIGKKLVKQQYLRTFPHIMANFGSLTAAIGWRVWGTPATFNGFHILAALLHGTRSGRQPNFAALSRECHLHLAGRPSHWASAHILVTLCVSRTRRKMYCGHTRLCVCLYAAVRPHYCTDPYVTWGRDRGCSLVVHYWADLQSVHRLRCYGNITRTLVYARCARVAD